MTTLRDRPYKILVSGNCLAGMIATAIDEVATIIDDPIEAYYVRNYVNVEEQEFSTEELELIASADAHLLQIDTTVEDPLPGIVSAGARQLRYPPLRVNWLWPFATGQHPKAYWDDPYIVNGIFNVYLSDSVLLRLMEEETDPDRVIERYYETDPTKHINLDRLYEATRSKMRRTDAEADVAVWPLLEKRFRDERVFWDAGHPCWPFFFDAVVDPLLRALDLGVDDRICAVVKERLGPANLFWNHEAPIHPRVAEHFGLSWWSPDLRYKLEHDGYYTFDEYIRRFVAFKHDPRLYTGFYHSRAGDRKRGERDLRAALADAPNNSLARSYLGSSLIVQGRDREGLAELTSALADPDVARDSQLHSQQAKAFLRTGKSSQATAAAERAIDLAPDHAPYHGLLGRSLSAAGRSEDALAAFQEALHLDPFRADGWFDMASLLVRMEGGDDPLSFLQCALDFQPDHAGALLHVAQLLEKRGDLAGALAAAQRGVALPTGSASHWRVLGQILYRTGRDEQAADAFAKATSLRPDDAGSWAGVAEANLRLGRRREALSAIERAIALDPSEAAFQRRRDEIVDRLKSRNLARA